MTDDSLFFELSKYNDIFQLPTRNMIMSPLPFFFSKSILEMMRGLFRHCLLTKST